MADDSDTIRLEAEGASAMISRVGAEPSSWRVGGRDLLWSGDPDHWGFRAPILFPLVGASAGGDITVKGRSYPMPQHGFARRATFSRLADSPTSARLRLTDSDETRAAYPFRFVLDVAAKLTASSLSLTFEVTNTDKAPMPYALGFHPAFLWPFEAERQDGHRIEFGAEEIPDVPEVAAGGLLSRMTRRIPLDGCKLPLDASLFTEALVFLHARSSSMSFVAPSGAAIVMETDGFPHLAVWTKPSAPFLSLECWTGHADWEGASGELAERDSMRVLRPGESARHAVTLTYRPPLS